MHELSLAAVASIFTLRYCSCPQAPMTSGCSICSNSHPRPTRGRRLRTKTVADLLKRHRISRISALQVVVPRFEKGRFRLRTASCLPAPQSVRILVAQAKLLHSQEAGLEREIKRVLARMQNPPGR